MSKPVVAIIGRQNVGKSTLLNRIAGKPVAIVEDFPGTTRDLLRVDIQVDGLPVRLVDTAGLRDSPDPVEQEGVRRARDQIARVLVRAGFDEERARRRARAVMTAIFGIAVQAIFDPQDWPSDAQRQALRQALSAIEEADATRA